MVDLLRARTCQPHQDQDKVRSKALFSEVGALSEPTGNVPRKHWLLRKALLLTAGRTGAVLLSSLALTATTILFDLTWAWFVEAVVVLTLVRTGYFLTRGPNPVLETTVVRRYLRRLCVDEIKISLAFLAAGLFLNWSLPKTAMAFFVLSNLSAQTLILWSSRYALKVLVNQARNGGACLLQKRVLIVGTGRNGRKVADMLLNSPQYDARLGGFLDFHRTGLWSYRDTPLIGSPDLLPEIIAGSQVDALFIAVEAEDLQRCGEILRTAEKMGIAAFFVPEPFVPESARVRPTYVGGLPALLYRAVPDSRVALVIKGLIDRVGALVGLVLASPLILAVAVLIKLDCSGPILFKQTRAGINGKLFKLLKFRTMCCDAEGRKGQLMNQNEMSGPVFKMKNDPRITRVGRFLRKYSIDEIPQFLNVLKGEMSLVGPRPPLPKEVAGFEPWQHRKLSMKPGVTCTWQVNGRNAIDFEEWMKLDLEYIDTWSLWKDAKILARTIPTVIKGTGS